MTAADVEEFLGVFFGPGNEIELPPGWRSEEQWRRQLLPFVEDLEQGTGRPTILPRRLDGVRYVYALAHSDKQARRLVEALRAFVGPTWSLDSDGRAARPWRSDLIDATVQQLTGAPFFRLTIPDDCWPAAWNAVLLMREVWLRAPARELATEVPLGRLLRDLDLALAAGDAALSDDVLRRLNLSGLVAPANLIFLEVRRLHVLGEHQALLDLLSRDDLRALTVPRSVRDALFVALQRHVLAPFEHGDDLAGALEAVHEWTDRFTNFLAHGTDGLSLAGRSAYLTVIAGQPAATRRTGALPEGDLSAWDARLIAVSQGAASVAPPAGGRAQVAALIDDGDSGAAWALLTTVDPPALRLRFAVRCALDLEDPEIVRTVRDWVDAASPADRNEALATPWFAEAWTRVSEQTRPLARVDGWPDLIRGVSNGTIADAGEVIETFGAAWPVSSVDEAIDAELVCLDLDSHTFAAVTRVLPRLLEAVGEDEPCPRTASTATALLALDDEHTPAHTRAVLAAARLAVLGGTSGYLDVLGAVREVSAATLSVRTVDWYLDFLDVLLDAGCPDSSARLAFAQNVLLRVGDFSRRLNAAQIQLVKQLAQDVAVPLPWLDVPREAAQEPGPVLGPATVLLYSLHERVTTHVRRALEALGAGITVHVSNDHDGSAHLQSQVNASDLLVLATRRAKHAATEFIERHKRPGSRVCYVPGAGAASMIATVLDALTAEGRAQSPE